MTATQIHYIDGVFFWSFFLFFISNAYEDVLVFYLCDKYLRGKLNERINSFISLFESMVSWLYCCEPKREHHGSVVVEADHLMAAREQRQRP